MDIKFTAPLCGSGECAEEAQGEKNYEEALMVSIGNRPRIAFTRIFTGLLAFIANDYAHRSFVIIFTVIYISLDYLSLIMIGSV